VEQNIVLRWVSEGELPALYKELSSASLAAPHANTIVDVSACPGTDTCKLGISSSRGLASTLREKLAEKQFVMDEAIRNLRIKVSGCFNSCGQHHVADLGFYGVSRNKGGYTVPHFQVVLGGQWQHNGGSYGLAIGAVPSKRIPDAVDRITSRYLAEKQAGESFQSYIKRIGKAAAKSMLDDLMVVPPHDQSPEYYVDWADAREYTIGDIGIGECAGEVVNPIDFQLADCEREAFEAQLALEAGTPERAASMAYDSMLHAALALLKQQMPVFAADPNVIVDNFRARLVDTQLFHDPFTGAKFAHYFIKAHEKRGREVSAERARQLVEEAQLFIEASHACYARMRTQPALV
jgi:sulfite reductase (ferredoxin)